DASLVNDWLSACHKFHFQCLDTPISVPDLWLIECDTLKVIEAPENASYIALSYVWAKGVRDEERISLNKGTSEKPYQLSENTLSQVIKDSITVTKQLGFHYLWVDKYCVDQNNPTVKHHQINNMDLIYRGADLTIIATSGEDERHGLPGVGVKRIPCEKIKIGEYTLTQIPSEIHYASHLSVWGRRGWTFQEELLSHHRLYFSDYQVSMLC
ncbi:HET-domain-containing protein, partial [Corynespora cassiicola Philippines]